MMEMFALMDRGRPVWIRAPKSGVEHYSGFSRAKLYALVAEGKIESVSIRDPGAVKGTRLFKLSSILDFVQKSAAANSKEAK